MNARKILIISENYAGAWPYLPELKDQLEAQDMAVSLLSFRDAYLLNADGTKHSYALLERLNKVRGINRLSYRITVNKLIRHINSEFDVVSIQYASPFYIDVIDAIRKRSRILCLTVWGSDFYRVSENTLAKFPVLLNKVDYISFNNPVTQNDFERRFPFTKNKLLFTGFGIGMFDKIRLIQRAESCDHILTGLSWPKDKIKVMVGYNGMPEQQHALLIDQIALLPVEIKDRIFVIAQCSYGGTPQTIETIKQSLQNASVNHTIINKFLSADEIARIRIATDIVLNAQKSDSFSGSLQEHLLASNILIAGNWLPYSILDRIGVFYLPVNKNEFGTTLKNVIVNFEDYKLKVRNNSDRMYDQSSWKSRIGNWIDMLNK